MGPAGEIVEQGTFEKLNASDSAGYVHSLALSARAPTESSATKEDETAGTIRASVEEPTKEKLEDDDSERNDRRQGDFTVYKYYIESIGWGSWSIFVSLCCFYGFGTVFPRTYICFPFHFLQYTVDPCHEFFHKKLNKKLTLMGFNRGMGEMVG